MILTKIKDVDLKFETETSIFSPNYIDNGTLAMLSVVDFLPGDKVLDLGCGYGVVGILAGKLIGEENVIMRSFLFQRILSNLDLKNWPRVGGWSWSPKDLTGTKTN